ncbi:MAG: sulfite exporter TauE/SafE family protein [Myxococcales bacterium]|nr:sulfite exporter TauE/SafE family protein [Myxococcales bacterium]
MIVPTILTAAALITAVISGMAGLGGGTVLVAIMFGVDLPPKTVVPVHAAVQLVSNGARTVLFARYVKWAALLSFLLAAVPTPFLAAPWVKHLDPRWVRLGMGLFILAVTWGSGLLSRLSVGDGSAGARARAAFVALLVAGLLAGGLGMVVGATGALIAPFFLRDDWSKETTIGTKALCQGAAHVLKLAAFSAHGFALQAHLALIVPMSVAVVLGTVIGKRIGKRLSDKAFALIFRLILSALSLKLCVSALLQLWR